MQGARGVGKIVREAGRSGQRTGTYAVADGSVVEVEAVNADERALQDVVDNPQRGAERGADASATTGR